MWERTLQDLIRGLRANSSKPQSQLDLFLSEAIEEIRKELRGGDMDLKAGAVLKMVYLMMLYPVTPPPSFAFHVVETMSSPKYHLKEVGYLASEGAFPEGTEEVVLTVNGIKKDLLSPSHFLPQLALTGLSSIVNPPLARDLSHDISSLLTHSRPQVRKRAVLCMYRVFQKYPEALEDNFSRLSERLDDDDQGVVSATINVLTELARQNAPNYLPLAPQLFDILSKSQNNWMLIKVVKLFSLLTPHEPRLIRKLLPPITNLITTTPAISLLYECVRTCITGGMLDDSEAGEALARVCVGKLSGFLEDEDQNLKYIALLALVKIIPTHAHLLEDYQDVVLKSVDDADLSIRLRALDLVQAMANQRNAQAIIDQLVSALLPPTTPTASTSAVSALLSNLSSSTSPHITTSQPSSATLLTPSYRLELTTRILAIGSADTFSSIPDFEWYLAVLIDLAYISRVDVGREIGRQIREVVGRVRSVREKSVELLGGLVRDQAFLEGAGRGAEGLGWAEVVESAVWVCGEFCEFLPSPPQMVLALLSPAIAKLPPTTIAICLHASAKIFGYWAAQKAERWDDDESGDLLEVRRVVDKVVEGLEIFKTSSDAEVQERALNILHLFSFILADLTSYKPAPAPSPSPPPPPPDPNAFPTSRPTTPVHTTPTHPKSLLLLSPLFAASYALPPVSSRAQASIAVPEGLDLDTPIYDWSKERAAEAQEVESGSDDSEEEGGHGRGVVRVGGGGKSGGGRKRTEEEEELRRVVAAGGKGKGKGRKKEKKGTEEEEEEKRKRKAARLARQRADPNYLGDNRDDDDIDLASIPVVKLDLGDLNARAGPSTRRPTPPPPQIDRDGEMPEGAVAAPSPAPAPESSSASSKPKKTSSKKKKAKAGTEEGEDQHLRLADVRLDLTGSGSGSRRGKGGFEEYEDGDADMAPPPQLAVPVPVAEMAPAVMAAPAAGEDVEVVRVVKKKKKVKTAPTVGDGDGAGDGSGVGSLEVVKKKKKKKTPQVPA